MHGDYYVQTYISQIHTIVLERCGELQAIFTNKGILTAVLCLPDCIVVPELLMICEHRDEIWVTLKTFHKWRVAGDWRGVSDDELAFQQDWSVQPLFRCILRCFET